MAQTETSFGWLGPARRATKCGSRRLAAFVKVCGCRPHEGGAARTVGRRTQTSKGGNRGRCGGVVRQALWGFGHCRSFAEVGWQLFRQAIAGATKGVGRLQWAESELRGGNGTTRRLS